MKVLTKILGKRVAAGTLPPGAAGDYSMEWEEIGMREPTKSAMLKKLTNKTFELRLREDLPEHVAAEFKAPSEKSGKGGVPFVAQFGQIHNRARHITEAEEVVKFYPGVSRSVSYRVAVGLLDAIREGAYLEEVDTGLAMPVLDD